MTHREIATRQTELGHLTMKPSCFFKVQNNSLFLFLFAYCKQISLNPKEDKNLRK